MHRDAIPLLGFGPFALPCGFEVQCPNRVSRIPPHLDVLFTSDGTIIAVESKCTEFVQGHAHTAVSPSYLALDSAHDARASSHWFRALAGTAAFTLLDTYQLIKHYLRLRHTYPDKELTLAYLYWEPANAATEPVFLAHRDELVCFAGLVAGDETCRFVHASYPELWRQWASILGAPAWLPVHIERLQRRYLVEV